MEVHLQEVVVITADREAAAAGRCIDLEGVAGIGHLERHIFVVELQLGEILDDSVLDVDRRLVLADATGRKRRIFGAPVLGPGFTGVAPMM